VANPASKAALCMTPKEIVQGAMEHGAAQIPEELLQLVEFLIERKIKNVIEVGTHTGGSLWAWCQIVPADGIIASIDWGDIPRCEFVKWHNPELLHSFNADSRDPGVPPLVAKLMPSGYDFLFIDGGHSEANARSDYEMYSPLVRKGGIVAFHDIRLVPKHDELDYQVKKYWEFIKSQRDDYIEFDSGKNIGIGILFN